MNKFDDIFDSLLEQIYNKTGRKHDIHYEQGKGALIVPHGYPLKPEYVILAIGEAQLQFVKITGQAFNIQ